MASPYRLRILWHRAMILFYFDNPEKQERHVAELEKLASLTDYANNKETH